jgi:hypothetical protein
VIPKEGHRRLKAFSEEDEEEEEEEKKKGFQWTFR